MMPAGAMSIGDSRISSTSRTCWQVSLRMNLTERALRPSNGRQSDSAPTSIRSSTTRTQRLLSFLQGRTYHLPHKFNTVGRKFRLLDVVQEALHGRVDPQREQEPDGRFDTQIMKRVAKGELRVPPESVRRASPIAMDILAEIERDNSFENVLKDPPNPNDLVTRHRALTNVIAQLLEDANATVYQVTRGIAFVFGATGKDLHHFLSAKLTDEWEARVGLKRP